MDSTLADVTFQVNGEQITAHRSILTARSDYFSKLLGPHFHEGQPGAQVEVRETTAAAFKSILRFLYTDNLTVDDSVVIQVMRLAHQYDIARVYSRCLSYCYRNLTVSTNKQQTNKQANK